MRFAIPCANGMLCMHFGHCEQFAVVDADVAEQSILGVEMLTPPPHEPGVLPRWLGEQQVAVVIAGGMGGRALSLFAEQGIEVVTGAPAAAPEELVRAFMSNTLETTGNVCDH